MSTMDLDTGVVISFHPLIFIGAALFAWLTTMFSAIKPASIAGKVSPIEAVRYTGTMVKAKTKRELADLSCTDWLGVIFLE